MPKGYPNSGVRKKPRPRTNTYKCWLDNALTQETDDCIIFPGATNDKGYGIFNYQRKPQLAHRYVIEQHLGRPLAPGMETLHLCDVRACVNKRHLQEGSHTENMRDCVQKGRKRTNPKRGEEHHQAKLTEAQVQAIRSEYRQNEFGYIRLASKYDVSQVTIYNIIKGRTWRSPHSKAAQVE